MTINYIKGDATKPAGEGKKVIVHVVNNKGGWGAGFVLALSKKWKLPEQKYRERFRAGSFKMGETQFVGVGGDITIANMMAQDGFGGVAIKYDALRVCLQQVYEFCHKTEATVHGPMFGAGLAGGDWKIIEKIVEEELCQKGVNVTVYLFG